MCYGYPFKRSSSPCQTYRACTRGVHVHVVQTCNRNRPTSNPTVTARGPNKLKIIVLQTIGQLYFASLRYYSQKFDEITL